MATDTITIGVTIDRYGHGERTYTFERDLSHCVGCGSSPIWKELGSEDYYTGESFYCTACRCQFSFQGPTPQDQGRDATFMDALVVAKVKAVGL